MKTAAPGLDDVNSLFTVALGIVNPWEVVQLSLDAEKKRLDSKGSRCVGPWTRGDGLRVARERDRQLGDVDVE